MPWSVARTNRGRAEETGLGKLAVVVLHDSVHSRGAIQDDINFRCVRFRCAKFPRPGRGGQGQEIQNPDSRSSNGGHGLRYQAGLLCTSSALGADGFAARNTWRCWEDQLRQPADGLAQSLVGSRANPRGDPSGLWPPRTEPSLRDSLRPPLTGQLPRQAWPGVEAGPAGVRSGLALGGWDV